MSLTMAQLSSSCDDALLRHIAVELSNINDTLNKLLDKFDERRVAVEVEEMRKELREERGKEIMKKSVRR